MSSIDIHLVIHMRISSIDSLKGLATLMVVVIHTEPFLAIPQMKEDWYYLGQILQQFSSFAVPFFFVAAGYFFSKGTNRENVVVRWRKYSGKMLALLVLWTLTDGVFWGAWSEQILKSGSLSPLWWNLRAVPSFAIERPDLFLLRGTAVPLWFLASLLASLSGLALMVRCSVRPTNVLLVGLLCYAACITTGSYANSFIGSGVELPLEQRGPFLALAFLSLGHFLSLHPIRADHSTLYLALAIAGVFIESAFMSQLSGTSFQERPYLISTPILAGAALLFALQNPSWGAGSTLSAIGTRSLGIYLVHTPILGAVAPTRAAFSNPAWEVFFPCLVLSLTYVVVIFLLRIPYLRGIVR